MSEFKFKAPDTFRENAWIKNIDEYKTLYDRSINDPEGFWAEMAEDFHWEKKCFTFATLRYSETFSYKMWKGFFFLIQSLKVSCS